MTTQILPMEVDAGDNGFLVVLPDPGAPIEEFVYNSDRPGYGQLHALSNGAPVAATQIPTAALQQSIQSIATSNVMTASTVVLLETGEQSLQPVPVRLGNALE